MQTSDSSFGFVLHSNQYQHINGTSVLFFKNTLFKKQLAGELCLHAIALIKNIRLQGVSCLVFIFLKNCLVLTRNQKCHVQYEEQNRKSYPNLSRQQALELHCLGCTFHYFPLLSECSVYLDISSSRMCVSVHFDVWCPQVASFSDLKCR